MSDNIESNESPSEQSPEVNPLQRLLTAAQLNASIRFYEADHELSAEDRVEIARDLQRVAVSTSIAGYFSGFAGFLGLTGYRKFVQKQPISGGRLVQKPFLSFLIGLSTLMVTHQVVGKVTFGNKMSELETLSKTKQLNVWKCMDYHQATLFYLYYRQSSVDPSFILKDPRAYREHEVTFHPSRAGNNNNTSNDTSNSGSLWNKLRIENGFGGASSSVGAENEGEVEEDEVEDEDGKKGPKRVSTKTGWERVRESLK